MNSMSIESKTRLSFWFPLIKAAGLPVPKTQIVGISPDEDRSMVLLLDGNLPPCWEDLINRIEVSAEAFGYPFFLRTDFTSNKHDWDDSCCVRNPAKLSHHVENLIAFSEMADMFGGVPVGAFVLREMLPTVPAFYAFNGMPIVREFRVFVRDGLVEHIQPYWPPEAIERSIIEPSLKSWRTALQMMSVLDDETKQVLTRLALQANAAVPGYWSVDFLDVSGCWVLTDMAEGDLSFKCNPQAAGV
jgi:hypothetical protein